MGRERVLTVGGWMMVLVALLPNWRFPRCLLASVVRRLFNKVPGSHKWLKPASSV